MPEDDQYPVIRLMMKCLQIQYLWPKSGEKCTPKFYFILYSRHLLTVPLILGLIAKKVEIFHGTGKFQFDGDFLVIFTQTGLVCFILAYGGIVDELAKKYQSLLELNSYGVPEDFYNFNNKMDLYTKIAMIYSQWTILLAVASPLLDYKNCMNREENVYTVCGVTNTWAPVDITVFPYNLITYIITCYSYFSIYSSILTITFYAAIISNYLTFQINYAKTLFGKTDKVRDYTVKKTLLIEAIKYHNEILRLAQQILDTLSNRVNFLHMVQTSVVLGVSIYGNMKEFQLVYLALCYGYFCQLSIQCYCGQKLMEECEDIGRMIYTETNWYEWELDLQKLVVIILRRSQIPVKTRAGPFGYLNYENLINVCKAAYSYLMFIESGTT